ncbi:MAG: oligosaccharide flippase family protein [candidate division Zixibacteria bacterium]|nr:oligosaccharide flippase family protein [candidate division Zixibacteria bacterium]
MNETKVEAVAESINYRKLITKSSIYMLGVLISKAVGFVMIPIYTRYLIPADYGVMELLAMTTNVVSMLIGIGLAAAVLRFYYDYDSEKDQNEVVSTALSVSLVLFGTVFGLLALNSSHASQLVFSTDEYTHHFRVIFVTMMLSAGIEIPMIYLRAMQRAGSFVTISMVRLVIQLSLNIIAVVALGLGVLGILYSSLISSIVVGGYLVVTTFAKTGISISLPKLKVMARYGYPMVFSSIGAFILTFSSRYFLNYYSSLDEVGIFALGFSFGIMVSFLVNLPFGQFWGAEMFVVAKRKDGPETISTVLTYKILISVLFCLGMSLFIKEVIEFIADEAYWRAWEFVPVICAAYVVAGMREHTNCGILITKQTKYGAYAAGIGVVVMIVLCFQLIPRYGAMGAAVATLVAGWVRFQLLHWYSQRLFRVNYDWGRILTAIGLAATLVVASYWVKGDLVAVLAIKSAMYLFFLFVLFWSGWIRPREREIIIKAVRNPRAVLNSFRTVGQ